jgi:rubredoxin
MGERILRGTRLGAASYEADRNTDLAPRRAAEYACPQGHTFTVPFAADAEPPAIWECRVCRMPARVVDGAEPERKQGKPARTHWDMLLERRSFDDLEQVLAERLAVLHEGASQRKSA